MGVTKSFDLVFREFTTEKRRYSLFVVNGFTPNLLLLEVLREVAQGDHGPDPVKLLVDGRLSYGQLETVTDLDDLALKVLSGPMGLIFEGADRALLVDVRAYPARQPSEPDSERVLLGPRDGFVETLIFNCALIRRRMRDPRLRFELFQVGKHTKLDVALAYVEGYTSGALVEAFRQRLRAMDIPGASMAEEVVLENLQPHPWNPFPTVRLTERPDVVTENLLEGRLAVLADTTPIAIVAPYTYLSHLHHPEDYHVPAASGTFLRWVTFLALLIGTFLTPFWLTLSLHPLSWLPGVGPAAKPVYPLLLELLVAEVGIDIIRRSVLNAPAPIATSLGILAAVVLGDLAAKAHIFTPEVLVYSAVGAIALFAIPSLPLGMAQRLVRVALLLVAGLLGWPGFLVGIVCLFVFLWRMDAFGLPYLWPLLPFDGPALASIVLRQPMTAKRKGPRIIRHLRPQRGGTV